MINFGIENGWEGLCLLGFIPGLSRRGGGFESRPLRQQYQWISVMR
jgi:hypothetical protein